MLDFLVIHVICLFIFFENHLPDVKNCEESDSVEKTYVIGTPRLVKLEIPVYRDDTSSE